MEQQSSATKRETTSRPVLVVGSISIILGIILLLSNYLHSYWLLFGIVPFIGLVMTIESIRNKSFALALIGSLIFGNGAGLLIFFLGEDHLGIPQRVGWLLMGAGLAWLMIIGIRKVSEIKAPWWPAIPGGLLCATALVFLFTRLRTVDFVLIIITGIGIALLGSGIRYRLFGLIIPGSLLCAIGPSIYLSWGTDYLTSALAKTGGMLVGFALGWAGITFFSRAVTSKFVWWPLIPCGVFAMVGWGLYIGGNPSGSLSFIGNTGSLVLILLGVYLLLLQSESKR